jgi:hypothetical protein
MMIVMIIFKMIKNIEIKIMMIIKIKKKKEKEN